jgi:type II secretory pathway predicted ATPase ExeA
MLRAGQPHAGHPRAHLTPAVISTAAVVPLSRLPTGEPWQRIGCTCDPFQPTHDPALFFASGELASRFASLMTLLEMGDGGLFLITGEAGIGKTMLLRVMEQRLASAGRNVVYHDAGVDDIEGWAHAIESHSVDGKADLPILLIDTTEPLDETAIQRLVLLYRAHSNVARTASLVIADRPESAPRLQGLAASVLDSKVTLARLRLERLSDAAIVDFIEHRLRSAGCETSDALPPEAIRRIQQQSAGVPTRILELAARELRAAHPLLLAPAPVGQGHANRQQGARTRPRSLAARAVIFSGLALLITAALAMFLNDKNQHPPMLDAGAPSHPPQAIQPATPLIAEPSKLALALVAPDAAAARIGIKLETEVEATAPVEGAVEASTIGVRLTLPGAAERVAGPSLVLPPAWGAATTLTAAPIEHISSAPAPEPVAAPEPLPSVVETAVAEPAPEPVATAPVALPEPEVARMEQAPPPPATTRARPTLSPAQIATLLQRAEEFLTTGDIASARLFYGRAAAGGDTSAMTALARTYEGDALRRLGVVGILADPELAAHWHRQAEQAGKQTQ